MRHFYFWQQSGAFRYTTHGTGGDSQAASTTPPTGKVASTTTLAYSTFEDMALGATTDTQRVSDLSGHGMPCPYAFAGCRHSADEAPQKRSP